MPERRDDAAAEQDRPRRRRTRRSWARRRHLGLITTGVALLVLVAGVLVVVATWDSGRTSFSARVDAAVASASAARPASVAPTPTPSAATTAAPGAAQVSTVKGAITAVAASSWTIAGANGLDYTIEVSADTEFTRKRTFGSFGVGDTVSVKGVLDQGTIAAQTVSAANPSS